VEAELDLLLAVDDPEPAPTAEAADPARDDDAATGPNAIPVALGTGAVLVGAAVVGGVVGGVILRRRRT
jgi:hypothetical protein